MGQTRCRAPHVCRTALTRSPSTVVALLLALAWVIVVPVPASASCATDDPPRSPAAFTGVVLSTRSEDRIARVRTDAGQDVTVRGTPGGLSSMTSADRTYEVGARYDFSPINDRSPYEDNNCSATRLLARGVEPAPLAPGATNATTPWLVLGLGALVAVGLALALSRRRARPRAG